MASEKIPFISLCTPQMQTAARGILENAENMFRRSAFILGEEVAAFERAFAPLAGSTYAIGVNSGLDALLLSLRSAGIGAGDEVITAPNSFVASAAAIALVGARPVFADVGEDLNLDPQRVRAAITHRTKAVMVVHYTGNPCAMGAFLEIAKDHKLCLIEDAAQAIGATYDGKPVGGFGDYGCFSLHPLKNLHVWGDGGVITVSDEARNRDLRMQRNHGLRTRDEADYFSYNSRLDTFQAIVGLASLPLLAEVTAARRRNALRYTERLTSLADFVKLPIHDEQKSVPVYHVYQVRAKQRDTLKAHLSNLGIETKIHYPIPIHLQPASRPLGYGRGDFPMTEKLADEILSLPVRENLTEAEIDRVCDAIHAFYRA